MEKEAQKDKNRDSRRKSIKDKPMAKSVLIVPDEDDGEIDQSNIMDKNLEKLVGGEEEWI